MVQQNQLIDIYNHFRLLTSESWTTQIRWSSIGFILMLCRRVLLSYATANSKLNESIEKVKDMKVKEMNKKRKLNSNDKISFN